MSERTGPIDPSCAVCGRRLLPGERANPFVTTEGEEVIVCELCKSRAEAEGWTRPDQSAFGAGSTGPSRRRQRSPLLSGLRRRIERENDRPEEGSRSADRELGGLGTPRAEAPSSAPAPAPPEGSSETAGSRTRAARPTRNAAGPDLLEALAAFNESDLRRTVAGLIRSLGEARATGLAVRTTSGDTGARITVAWELAWYQWEVGPGARRPEVRQIAKGETIGQLSAADRNWNLIVARDGTLARRQGSAEQEGGGETGGSPAP